MTGATPAPAAPTNSPGNGVRRALGVDAGELVSVAPAPEGVAR